MKPTTSYKHGVTVKHERRGRNVASRRQGKVTVEREAREYRPRVPRRKR